MDDQPLYPSHACRADQLQPGQQVFLPLIADSKTFQVAGWEDGTLTVRVGGDMWEVPMAADVSVEVWDREGRYEPAV